MSEKVNFFDNFFSNKGPLSKVVKNYQIRDGQIEMSKFIHETIANGQSSIIEAGTGIGKTIGYLLPIIRENKKIIISTATKNLQEQLIKKDFPILQKSLGLNFNVTTLKGRANYLCHHRVNNNSNLFYSKKDAEILNDIGRKLENHATGDLSEIKDISISGSVQHAITSTSENCLFNDCKFNKECFINKARRKAHGAEIIIVNHHLFFSDFFNEDDEANSLLPEADVIVFDEAHNLFDLATLFSSKIFSSFKLNRTLDELLNLLKKSFIQMDNFSQSFNNYNLLISELMNLLRDENKRASVHRLKNHEQFVKQLIELKKLLLSLINSVGNLGYINREIDNNLKELKKLSDLLYNITNPEQLNCAVWMEKFNNSFSIHITPIDIKNIFGDDSKQIDASLIFSSATITANENFDYFKNLTGLKTVKTKIIQSPFDYKKNALLHLPQNLPDPNDDDFFESLSDYIYPAIKLNEGKTLILTTSIKGIGKIGLALEHLIQNDKSNLLILKQGDMPNNQLIDQFKSNPNTILIGSYAFWEGVDLIGNDLSLLVIDKLPFKSPDDPIVDAKINILKETDFFMKTQIPMTSLLMKQGLGRLIRDFNDRGVAIVCDNRMYKKNYGRQILRSLPPYRLVDDYNDVLKFIENLN
jgi:ATP-dependent DNA helicase DinG